ncbi:hypothetical protein F0U44_14095 [Nocardioides humilatus]|uniref:Uncharacterized protein n=1 Tax=Nocardioides humilatus TaxID=2607660 RepID=A0A5B1LFU9_9ACTN|nr:right-handed parallel beta-helix repeat-containing protein [Nocardioides humilatus]KAA1419552.1 hypothetical protein F0U44_14095 [Nocardioides humilatus]
MIRAPRMVPHALVLFLVAGLMAVVLPSVLAPAASAHVERPSYWPNPKADCSISPCAGGAVPKARSLASAVAEGQRGETRVVCQNNSMKLLRASIERARKHGYHVRPTEKRSLSAAQADELLKVNKRLFSVCGYRQIQFAINDSGNNDRVVVMPGLYTEPHSRQQPTHDPACARYTIPAESGDPGALSHDYQIHCPNDANLVAVIGRGPDTAAPPSPPRENRHGIPNAGKCIRCNFQLEGSGVSADDVIVEAGDKRAGNGGPSAVGYKKDVGIFIDRADGFVLRNLTVRHAREHDIYILETDGYRFEHFKTFYAGAYGVLTFVEDHGLIQRCHAVGNGDSGIYPGSGADSTDHRYKPFYPKYRFSQVVRYCDMNHNVGGFSGTDSHGTLVEHNNFFGNALGFTTDVFTAPGHPGFPQHGNVFRHNNFYSNNFNPFQPDSDVEPFIAAPVGTGGWWAGGNYNQMYNNRFWDNWRRGLMLFAVPDATVCGPPPVGSSTPVPGCNPLGFTTSFGNSIHDNVMGVDLKGRVKPNGKHDFWWDSFIGNTGNCWWGNTGPGGADVTSTPRRLPDCDDGTDPSKSMGLTNLSAELELIACLAGFTVVGYPDGDPNTCTWTKTPKEPGKAGPDATQRTRNDRRTTDARMEQFAAICRAGLAPRLCKAYAGRLPKVVDGRLVALPEKVSPVILATPVATEGRLSTFTCSWWRQADDGHRLGMVQRIKNYASGRINGGPADASFGYGASLRDNDAALLFEDRCSTFHAGAFALYKIYGAAAAFAAAG